MEAREPDDRAINDPHMTLESVTAVRITSIEDRNGR